MKNNILNTSDIGFHQVFVQSYFTFLRRTTAPQGFHFLYCNSWFIHIVLSNNFIIIVIHFSLIYIFSSLSPPLIEYFLNKFIIVPINYIEMYSFFIYLNMI